MNKKAKIGGKLLSFFEVLKNGTNVDIKDIINYLRFRKGNSKWN